jgi:hypothetical protein
VATFLPPNFDDPSLRGKLAAFQLYHPIYKIPSSDVYARLDNVYDFSQEVITSSRHYTKFGRPSWFGLPVSSVPGNSAAAYSDLIDFAGNKLMSGKRASEKLDGDALLAGIMILYAPFVSLPFTRASGLTASRMAILRNISISRDVLQVGYRSEPVLVHAAHRMFREHKSDKCTLRSVQLDIIIDLVKQGLVEEGPHGELAARFLLLQALSEVGFQEVASDDPGSTQVSSASVERSVQINYCTVRQLLQGLNVHVGVSDIDSVLLDGRVLFLHRTNACGHITSASIAMCFYRGAAIVCKRGQQAIDLFIPVLLNSETIWWKKGGGLRLYATDADDETSDSDYFLPAS